MSGVGKPWPPRLPPPPVNVESKVDPSADTTYPLDDDDDADDST
jgi:hypothetical protein